MEKLLDPPVVTCARGCPTYLEQEIKKAAFANSRASEVEKEDSGSIIHWRLCFVAGHKILSLQNLVMGKTFRS